MSGYEGHTPGPWEAKHGKVVSHFVSAQGTVIAGMMRGGQAELDDDTLAANCALMAAAPSLLTRVEALERLVWEALDIGEGGYEWQRHALALVPERPNLSLNNGNGEP